MRTRSRLLLVLLLLASAAASGCREDLANPRPLPADEVAERIGPILALGDPLERSFQASALLQRAPQEAQPALQAAFDAAAPSAGAPELVAFVMWWAEFQPLPALAWVQTRTEPDPISVASILRVMAFDEPLVAFNLLETLPGNLGSVAAGDVVASWRASGQPGLLERVQSIPDLAVRQSVSEHLAKSVVAERGAVGALEWAELIENEAYRDMLMLRIASAAADQGEGPQIAEWATPLVTSGRERPSGLVRRIGTRWIRSDPEAAMAWLESLPAGLDRDDGVMESFRDWMTRDREAAMAWAEATPRERWNEPAFSIYVRHLAQQNPVKALTLLGGFEDAQLRSRMTRRVARNWLRSDPAAAVAWLEETDTLQQRIRVALEPWVEQARNRIEAGAEETSDGGDAQPALGSDADSSSSSR